MSDTQNGGADFDYWLIAQLWDSREATALLLGYEPDFAFGYGPDEDAFLNKNIDPKRDELREKAERLELLLRRAQLAGAFGKVQLNRMGDPWGKSVTGAQWIGWAQRNNICCAPELLAALEKYDDSAEEDSGEIHPRTETSLLRIIGALLQELKTDTNKSQAKIIDDIVDMHGHKDGISRSTLENCFSQANLRLQNW